jgi:hypothetical protein
VVYLDLFGDFFVRQAIVGFQQDQRSLTLTQRSLAAQQRFESRALYNGPLRILSTYRLHAGLPSRAIFTSRSMK